MLEFKHHVGGSFGVGFRVLFGSFGELFRAFLWGSIEGCLLFPFGTRFLEAL